MAQETDIFDGNLIETWEFEFRNWGERVPATPRRVVKHKDMSHSYETRQVTIFELNNGEYLLAEEEGCSCYSDEDAVLNLYPTEKMATDSFNRVVKKWKREDRGIFDD